MANFRDNKFSRGGGGFRGGGGGGGGFRNRDSQGPVTMHPAVCDNCRKDCEVPFRPTSGKPIFCSSCFENKGGSDSRRSEGRSFERPASFEDRPMFEAVCDECGNNCKVPFRPSGDKPIYCSNCFGEKKGTGNKDRIQSQPQSSEQLEALNNKLDRILKLLEPAVKTETKPEKPVEESIEATPKKAKKSKKVASEKLVS